MSITTPAGFVASGLAAGIKATGALDLSLLATEDGRPVPTAATFTRNLACAAPVQVSRAHLASTGGRASAVLVSSGNANAATGDRGRADATAMCRLTADALGVERVRDTHSGYLASCGLTIPLLDNIQRTVDFAIELQRIVHRFNTENDRNVQLRAGINSGTVSSGLVGHAGLVYDLWGSAVNLASRMRRDRPESGVYVTTRVYEATRDAHRYRPAGSIVVGDTQEPIWQLAEDL